MSRVVLYHPAPRLCCETDVELLAERRFDWMEVEGHLTIPSLDWMVTLDVYGSWEAFGRFAEA
ncbi:hypothetical protein AB0C34_18955 [Nocardia sp. NPDC049220]|uniref:hypothetical protein n=1 Tax=Nocardia sp. NPDC049220 TaxID=3155273 RepID=UPI0034067BE4